MAAGLVHIDKGVDLDPETGYYLEPPQPKRRKNISPSAGPKQPPQIQSPMMLEAASSSHTAAPMRQRRVSRGQLPPVPIQAAVPGIPGIAHDTLLAKATGMAAHQAIHHQHQLLQLPVTPLARGRAPKRRGCCSLVFSCSWSGLKRRMGSLTLALLIGSCFVPDLSRGFGEVLRGASQVTTAAGVVAGAGANITVAFRTWQ